MSSRAKIGGGRPEPSPALAPAAVVALAAAVWGGGCFVESSPTSADCAEDETFDYEARRCYVQCRTSSDCAVNGQPVGKECVDHRCVFPFGERVPAPDFCLTDVNPRSATHGGQVCLVDSRGEVVLLMFGLLA